MEVYLILNFVVDIWSIGCIFAELLTGEVLFHGLDDLDQLIKIINLFGSPNAEQIEKLDPSARQILRSLPKRQPMLIEELFPDGVFPDDVEKKFCAGISFREQHFLAPLGRQLLSKMLIFDPEKRISVGDALKEPYVGWKKYRTKKEKPPKGVYDDSVESQQLSTKEWKSRRLFWHLKICILGTIFERIKKYEMEHKI